MSAKARHEPPRAGEDRLRLSMKCEADLSGAGGAGAEVVCHARTSLPHTPRSRAPALVRVSQLQNRHTWAQIPCAAPMVRGSVWAAFRVVVLAVLLVAASCTGD